MERGGLFTEPTKLRLGLVTRKHTRPPQKDWKLTTRRKRWDISRDWRGTTKPTAVKMCGRRFKMSQATKVGASVRPRCQRSWTQFMLILISTKTELWSSHCFQVTSHCDSGWVKNPAETKYKWGCWSRYYTWPCNKNMCQSASWCYDFKILV